MSDHSHVPCLVVRKTIFGLRHKAECVYCGRPMSNRGETAEVRTGSINWRAPAFACALIALAIYIW